MGLLPEFFILLGIEIFLAVGLLSALLYEDMPSSPQYIFQGVAIVGVGLLYMTQSFINSGVLGRDPADATRFWVSVVYLTAAVSNVVGLNVYLAVVRWKMGLASAFIGTVTVPILMVSTIFVSSFLGTGGEVGFTPASIMMLATAAVVISLSMFGFLRQVSRHLAPHGRGASPRGLPTVSEVAGGSVSTPLGAQGKGLTMSPRSKQEDWEESPAKENGEESKMKNIRDILDLKHKKSLRPGLLLLSTLLIFSAGALIYASIVYERTLNVGDTSGVTTGSGSTSSAEASFTPASIMMLAVAALVISLSMFGFLRQASRHLGPHGPGVSPTGLPTVSGVAGDSEAKPSDMPGMGLRLPLPSMRGEDWEEFLKKEEGDE